MSIRAVADKIRTLRPCSLHIPSLSFKTQRRNRFCDNHRSTFGILLTEIPLTENTPSFRQGKVTMLVKRTCAECRMARNLSRRYFSFMNRRDVDVLLMSEVKNLSTYLKNACSLIDEPLSLIDLGSPDNWDNDEARTLQQRAQVVIADPPTFGPKYIQYFENIVWLQSTYAGCDALFRGHPRAYLATRLGGEAFGPAMSEYIFMHVCAHERKMRSHIAHQDKKVWFGTEKSSYRTLDELSLGTLNEIYFLVLLPTSPCSLKVFQFSIQVFWVSVRLVEMLQE